MALSLLRHSRFGAVLVLGSAFALGACSNDAKKGADAGTTAATLGTVPAPVGLMANVFLATPEVTWQKARLLAGGGALFLPPSFGGMLATLLGLPIGIAGEIDGGVAVVGAMVDGGTPPTLRSPQGVEAKLPQGSPPPRVAIGIHVKEGGRFVDQLTKGESARWSSHVDPTSTITALVPKDGRSDVALGVLGNYLLVAPTKAELTLIGPYVARTLPSASMPKDDLAIEAPEASLAGPISARVKTAWESLKPKPNATPTVAGALLSADHAFETLLGVLGDASGAWLGVNLEQGMVRARADLRAKPGQGPAGKLMAELARGDAKPLLELPADTLVAALWRDHAADRKAQAEARADTLLELLDKKAEPADRAALAAVFNDLGAGRGDWFTAGLRFGSTGPSGFVRSAVTDVDTLTKAMTDLTGLAKQGVFQAWLKEASIDVATKKTTLPNVGQVDRVRFVLDRKAAAKKGAPMPSGSPSSVDLLYSMDKDLLLAATGLDASEAYTEVVKAKTREREGTSPVRASIESLGDGVTFALFAEPLRAIASLEGHPGEGPSAPVVLAAGMAPQAGTLWLRVDVANAAVQELAGRAFKP
jgi:hypothetical protein